MLFLLFLCSLIQATAAIAELQEESQGPPAGSRVSQVVSIMLGLKLLVAAGAAAIIIWKCFYEQSGNEDGEDVPHDLSLEVVEGPAVKAKIRASHQGEVVLIGRLPENTLTVSSDHVSGVHAHVFWERKLNRWIVRDVGSMNGTMLNDEVISLPDRKIGPDHALSYGDCITMANAVKIMVELHPPLTSTNRGLSDPRILSSLKVAPRSGSMNDPGLQVPASLLEPNSTLLSQRPRPEAIDLYFAGLQAEFAFVTQVGMHHWQQESGSEDVAFWETPFSNFLRAGLFGVCDGHFGDRTSKELQVRLPQTLQAGIPSGNSIFGSDNRIITNLLKRTFPELDAQLQSEDGSTATVMLAERLEDDTLVLQAANVGDSMGILIDPDTGDSQLLTADHRVCAAPEKQRLRAIGIPLTHNDTRAFMLNLARAMGDKAMKEVNSGLISEPHVSRVIKLRPDQSAVAVLASDGLWDGVTFAEASRIVTNGVHAGMNVDEIVMNLVNRSISKGVPDDITIALVRFLPVPKAGQA
ncbi:hypothetical protein BSKO_08184 [Bryopsis sp. KO-2023]|nr:hypothetical protein BSKO_08184 [Bryopsis sp. KO-2023]